MGQYYKVALVDNEWHTKVITPDGWKLLEHSYYGNNTMRRIEKLIFKQWMNLMWIWDYAQCSSLVWKHTFEDTEAKWYDEIYTDDEILQRDSNKDYYLVNHFTKEFINMTKQEMNKELQDRLGWVIHPLPILCRVDWDHWWGDYTEDMLNGEYLWRRAWDIISIYELPRDYDEQFVKEWYHDKTDVYFFKE